MEVVEAEADERYEFGGVQCHWELAMSAEVLMLVSAWLVETAPQRDAAEVVATVRTMAGGEKVDSSEVERFCTNARFIKLINSADGPSLPFDQVVGKC